MWRFRMTAVVWAGLLAVGCHPDAPTDDPPKRDRFAEERVGGDSDPPKKSKFGEDRDDPKTKPAEGKKTPFDGERAIKYLKQVCDIGPRVSGSEGMKKQIELLTKHFEGLGGKVTKQEFQASQKSQAKKVGMTNLIVSWYPERKTRVILCAHYDTRPYADQEGEERNWSRPFVSANDGGSGIALMMELAHHMKNFPTAVGVDFVLFDGEEYVFRGPTGDDDYFLGSTHFATEYQKAEKTRGFTYTAAVLFDMVGHEGARLNIEGYSWKYAQNLVVEVWKAAEDVKAKSFRTERGFKRSPDVQDDHLPLLSAGIPAIDVIDFDYEHWHKLSDTPDKCSPKQLAEVAEVITTWLKRKKEK